MKKQIPISKPRYTLTLLILVLACVFAPTMLAQVVTYPLRTSDMSRKAPQILHDKMTASPMVRGPGLAQDTRFQAFSSHQAESSTTPVEDDYIEFTVTSKPGYSFTPSLIEYALFSEYSFSSWEGPRDFQLQYSVNGFTTPGTVLATHLDLPYGSRGATTLQTRFTTDLSSIGTHFCTISFRLYIYHRQGSQRTAFAGFGNGLPGEPTGQQFVSWAGEGTDVKIYGSIGLGEGSTDIRITSTESTDPLEPGQSMTYDVTVTNDGPETTRDLAIDVPLALPQGVTLTSLIMDRGQIWHGSIWVLGELAVGASARLTATVQAASTAPAGNDTIRFEPALKCLYQMPFETQNDAAPQATSIPLDLQLTITESVDPVVAGSGPDNLSYVVTVNNIGNSAGTHLVVDNFVTVPSGAALTSWQAPAGTTFDGDTWIINNLPKGAKSSLTLRVTVPSDIADGAQIANAAQITGADQLLYNTGDDAAALTTTVKRQVDLAVNITPNSQPVIAGSGPGNLTYELTLRNQGPSDASGIALNTSLNLPPGVLLDFVSAPTGTSWAGNTWVVGDLTANSQKTLLFTLTAVANAVTGVDVTSLSAGGLVANEQLIMTQNDSDSESRTIEAHVDLTFSGGATPDPVIAGSGMNNLEHVIIVSNRGPSTARGVQILVVFNLPKDVVVSNLIPSGSDSYSFDTWHLDGALAPGESRQLIAQLTVGSAALSWASSIQTETRILAVDGILEHPTLDNQVVVTSSVERRIALELSLTDSPDPAGGCGSGDVLYTFQVKNLGPSDASGLSLYPSLLSKPVGVGLNLFDYDIHFGNPWNIQALAAGATKQAVAGLFVAANAPEGDDLIVAKAEVFSSNEPRLDHSMEFVTESTSIATTDRIPPVLICPDNITVNASADSCGAVVNYETPVGSDNCDVTTEQTAGLPSGSEFPVGTTVNTFVATDASGNSTECSFQVTVVDDRAPDITCPADIVVNNDSGKCGAVVVYQIGIHDNCSGTILTQIDSTGLTSGSFFPVGVTTQRYQVTDASGNTQTCSFSVTVEDREAPVASGTNLTLPLNSQGQLAVTAQQVDGGSTDNCGIASLSLSQTAFNCSHLGVNNVILTVTDIHGNQNTCLAVITVTDSEAPVITLLGSSTVVIECGDDYVEQGAQVTDVCGGDLSPSLVVDASAVDNHSPGNYIVTYNVTDPSGNKAAEVHRAVTVADTTRPMLSCPGDIIVGASVGACSAVVTFDTPVGIDNCGATTEQTAGLPSGSKFPLGVTVNTFVATDASGNRTQCSFQVTVLDQETPNITCPGDIVVSNDSGQCGAVVNYRVRFDDNCSDATLTQIDSSGLSSGSFFPVGVTTQAYQVTDAAGNTETCSFSVTVEDQEPPAITLVGSATIILECGSAYLELGAEAADVCGGDLSGAIVVDASSVDIHTPGNYAVTYKVVDPSGNAATEVQRTVTVVDTTPPAIVCSPNIEVDADSQAGTPVSYLVTAPDLCDSDPVIVCEPASGSLFPIGTSTVRCIATDAHGNSVQCEFLVYVRSPQEMTGNLLDAVAALGLKKDLAAAFKEKLTEILLKIEAGDFGGAINQLEAFINQVEAKKGKDLTKSEQTQLIDAALDIIRSLQPGPQGALASMQSIAQGSPAISGRLRIQHVQETGEIEIQWERGVLQSRDSLDAPWGDVTQDANSLRIKPSQNQQFFRFRDSRPLDSRNSNR